MLTGMLNPSAAARLGEQRHRSSPSDPTPREIEDHVFTGHARFRSWCAAFARGRGRAERHHGDGSQGGRGRFWNQRSVMGFVFLSDGVTKSILPHLIPAKKSISPGLRESCRREYQRFGQFGVPRSGVSVSGRAFHSCTAQETVAEGDPQSNGAAESFGSCRHWACQTDQVGSRVGVRC